MRLVMLIAGLTGGGSERVLSMLANECAGRGHHVTIVTLDQGGDPFYPLAPAVHRVSLGLPGGSRGVLGRVVAECSLLRLLHQALRRLAPDGVIAFGTETNVRALIAGIGTGARVVVSERSDPASNPVGGVWARLRRRLYRHAHTVVLQTETARTWIAANTGAPHTAVIPNPAVAPAWREADAVALPHPVVVTLGRLRVEKGIDLLVEAFARTRGDHPEWRLAVIGDGPERAALERLVDARGMRDAVTFLGQLERPAATLRHGDLFVLPSRFEGFPNALVEAMALGLPAISFDCPSGPSAIITHGVDGHLVPAEDVDALAAALSRLMGDAPGRARLGRAAAGITARFAVDGIVSAWLQAVGPRAGRRDEVPAASGALPS